MKTHFYTKTFSIALVVAVVAAANVSLAQSPSSPPPAEGALPPNVQPGSPLAEVIKLVQAGVEVGTIRSYVANTPGAFGLDAGIIVYLNDVGVPTDIVNAMMEHDKNISAPVAAVAPPAAAPVAAPESEVTVNQFYENLSPYGSWVEVEGYGRCWRPTTVVYDATWQPYCDRGHWVYSDYGWYWNSDYSWGVTFHYGRWFHHSRFGWCWWPDTVWAPSWVMWRSHDDYCGWAPLPPFTVYRPGAGFFYRGARVAVGFDFGLGAESFTFVSLNHFSEPHPRYYRAEPERVRQFFNQSAIINNYNVHNRTIVNGGIPVERINAVVHRPIQPVPIAQIPHAERQGWRGAGLPADNRVRNVSPGNSPSHNTPVLHNDQNNNSHLPASPQSGVNPAHQPENNRHLSTPDRSINQTAPARPPVSVQTDIHAGNRDVPNHVASAPADTHQNVAPSAGGNAHQSPAETKSVRPVENNQRSQAPSVFTSPRSSTPSVFATPRNSTPSAPAPSPSRNSDRDK